jgi:hypothetical protein
MNNMNLLAVVLLIGACGVLAGQFHHLFGIASVLGAILCAACFVRPRALFVIGIGGMLLRDLLVGFTPFTGVRVVAMVLVVGIVVLMKVRPNLRSLLTGLVASSAVFHLALAVGDWATGTCAIFPRTAQGLVSSVVTSLPYFQRALVGDVLFASLFLSLYGLAAYGLWLKPTLSTK